MRFRDDNNDSNQDLIKDAKREAREIYTMGNKQ